MGDMGDDFRHFREQKKAARDKFGVNCPECVRLLPKAHPSILLPSQRCKIHKYYRDPRPRTHDNEWMHEVKIKEQS